MSEPVNYLDIHQKPVIIFLMCFVKDISLW